MILDLFKPAWQSTNINRRRKGVQKLNPEVTGEADALYSLASSDREQSVRLAAIERISNITLLVRLLKNAPTSLEQDKLGRLVTIAALKESDDKEGLQKAVDLIDMDDDLFNIAINANSSDAQVQAVHKIRKEEHLLDIAKVHPLSKLRLVAAEKIENPTLLVQLLDNAKGKDKSVWRVAKDKLDTVKAYEVALEKQREVANECFQQMQAMQNKDVDIVFKQKWQSLVTRWKQVPNEDKIHLDSLALFDSIQTRVDAFEARHVEEQYQSATKVEAEAEQIEALNLLTEALGILKNTETDQIDIPSLRAILTTQRSRWETAAQLNSPLSHQQAAYERDTKKLSQAIDAIYTLREHLGAIKSLHVELHQLAPDDMARNSDLFVKAKKLLKKINWPVEVIVPKDMQRLNTDFQCLEERQRRQSDVLQQHENNLTQLLEKLQSALNNGQLNSVEPTLKKAQAIIKKLPNSNAEQSRTALKPILAQYAELKDWQSFAAQPKKEALILSMEGLAQDNTDIDPSVRLEYIQKLQQEWRELGRLSLHTENKLWDKFQAASKAAYAPCKAHYEEQSNTRERNKAHKQKMCEQLTNYIEGYTWNKADWNSVQDTIKLARSEWKRYSPVDRKFHKNLEEQFHTLLKELESRLNAHKQGNQRIKQRLLEQAQALLDKEDLQVAIDTMRALRDEWRKVGMLPPDSYKQMNDAFYESYNALMARKQQQWSDVVAQHKHNAEQVTLTLDALDQVLAKDDSNHLLNNRHELQNAEQAFIDFSPLAEQDQKNLRKRFEKLQNRFQRAIHMAKSEMQQTKLQTLWHRGEILRQLEASVLASELTSNQLQRLTEEWNQIPDTNHQAMASLNARFDAAIHAYENQDLVSALHKVTEKADADARELSVLMDILAEVDSLEADVELRMQLQVNRLNQSLQTRGDEQHNQWSEADTLSLQWCTTGPISTRCRTNYESRFKNSKTELSHDH